MRRNFVSSMPVAIGKSSLNSLVTPEALENAAKEVDRQMNGDRQYPELAEQINVSQGRVHVPLQNSSGYVKKKIVLCNHPNVISRMIETTGGEICFNFVPIDDVSKKLPSSLS